MFFYGGKMKKIIYIILISCFIFYTSSNIYGSGFLDTVLGTGSNWFTNSTSGDTSLAEDVEDFILEDLFEMLEEIGVFIVIIAGIFLGVKYLISSSMDKAAVKESLIGYCVGVGLFALAIQIKDFVYGMLIDFSGDGDSDNMIKNIFATITPIINVIAIASVVAVGLKYMWSSSVDRAAIKNDLIRIVIGIILIYATFNIANLISEIGVAIVPKVSDLLVEVE